MTRAHPVNALLTAILLAIAAPATAQNVNAARTVPVANADGPRHRNEAGPPSLQRGQQIYIEHCALCHGMAGNGDGPRSAFFSASAQFIPDFATKGYLDGRDSQVLQSIRQGLKRLPEPAIVMPQFKYILSEKEIRSVLAYVHTLAKKPGPATGSLRAVASDDGEALAQRHNCLACHQAGAKIVGPAYRDVAARYKAQPAAVATLAEKIRAGSTGAWGNLPMPPMPNVPEAERKRLAEWILRIE